MRLLIVDDETLTREGLLHSIDWQSLNITHVQLADDGLRGLESARKEMPDIILSDIRMPRMDGIKMAERIRELSPDVNIIFMSGYSDREYLKAAIKLKAVSYVEKPLNPPEIEEAVLTAIENSEQLKRTKRSESVLSLAKAARLALEMTYPLKRRGEFSPEDFTDLSCGIGLSMSFTTYILKSTHPIDEISNSELDTIHSALREFLVKYHLDSIYVSKYNQYLVYHIFGETKPGNKILLRIASYIKELFSSTAPFFLAVGDTVAGVEHVYQSYSAAVTLLQSSFFYDYNSILTPFSDADNHTPVISDYNQPYREALTSGNFERLHDLENKIFHTYKNNLSLLPNQVKDIYYRLFMVIQNTYKEKSISELNYTAESILELVQNCHTLNDLHQLLAKRSKSLTEALKKQEPENSVVYAIKEFISTNYTNESLSVKEISTHVHMTSTYVCTLFKKASGMTLNQYLTEFRIEKAKQLLTDSEYKITDISDKVGYSDGNYFGKSFKKHVGLSPSEYREKMLL